MKHVVFAGTFEEAQEHANDTGLDHGQWVYGDARNKIEGLNPHDIITHRVGTWDYNSDVVWTWRYYQDMCREHGVGGGEDE